MSPEKFDVVVVGAGPGGLLAAIEAAKRGLSVQVFDKKKIIGTPVRCGEYLPLPDAMRSLLPAADPDMMNMFDMPPNAVDNRCEVIRVLSPRGKAWEFPFESNIVNREIMEQGFAKEAEKLGAKIKLSTPGYLFRANGANLVGKTRGDAVEARVVIAADGFPSAIIRSAGLEPPAYSRPVNFAVNYQYHMEDVDIDPAITEMYMGNEYAPGGYGWIIPKGKGAANVGIGVRTPFMKGQGKERDGRSYLEYFVDKAPVTRDRLRSAKKFGLIADVLPVDGPIPKTYDDGLLATGDAACMVMPTNGGGIAPAMLTGFMAGRVAADYIQNGTSLSKYESDWRRAMGKEMFDSTKLRRFADFFMRSDLLFHYVMTFLGTGGIRDVVICRVPRGIGPFLAFF